MKVGNLVFDRNGRGSVKVAKVHNGSDHEEWQQYLSHSEWESIVKALTLPKEESVVPNPPVEFVETEDKPKKKGK